MSITVRQSEACALLKSLKAVQVIIADPPYGIAYHSNHYKEKNPHAPVAHDWNFQIAGFFKQAATALRDGGAIYLFTRWDVYPLWAQSIFPPLKLSNVIVWKKDNWSAGDLEGNFGNQHELIMFVTKGRHQRKWKRLPNVWSVPRIPHRQLRHPTEKPCELIRRAVLFSSDKGDLIVDPFCGSGPTGQVCDELGRDAILGDIDPKMIHETCNRLGIESPVAEQINQPPPCSVLNVVPPNPSDWGLHPEDIRAALGMDPGEHPVQRELIA